LDFLETHLKIVGNRQTNTIIISIEINKKENVLLGYVGWGVGCGVIGAIVVTLAAFSKAQKRNECQKIT
jgi:hypothetical protein